MSRQDDIKAVRDMSREEVVKILEEQGGYQCYDHESTEDLKQCLIDDIENDCYPVMI